MSICLECGKYQNCCLTADKVNVHTCVEFESRTTFNQIKKAHESFEETGNATTILCHSCKLATTCMYSKGARPIIHCELYE